MALQLSFNEIAEVIRRNLSALRGHPGFLSAQPGIFFRNGAPTNTRAIIVRVRAGFASPPTYPSSVANVPVQLVEMPPVWRSTVDAEIASPQIAAELATAIPPAEAEALSPYDPPANLESELNQLVESEMKVICHVSPDAGWPTLKSFLEEAKDSLTIAMYDLTAPHIDACLNQVGASLTEGLNLILDPKISVDGDVKANDLQETQVRDELEKSLGKKLDFVWAAVTSQGKTTAGIFPSAYHIKVAVRDHTAFWLSSGNMQSSNQPDIPILKDSQVGADVFAKYNREWHVIIELPKLARLYEKFIMFDIEEARPFQFDASASAAPEAGTLASVAAFAEQAPVFFDPKVFGEDGKPISVQPLLTPDNYAEHVLPLIQSAKESIDFQNQYIHLPKTPSGALLKLLQALLRKQQRGVTVRIILRDIGDTRTMIEALVAFGFDANSMKLQLNCHNKGIIVDGKTVVVGSHNYSSQGVSQNIDASLIFFNESIAKYYSDIFDNDWNYLATAESQVVPLAASAQAVAGTGTLPQGFQFYEDGGPTA